VGWVQLDRGRWEVERQADSSAEAGAASGARASGHSLEGWVSRSQSAPLRLPRPSLRASTTIPAPAGQSSDSDRGLRTTPLLGDPPRAFLPERRGMACKLELLGLALPVNNRSCRALRGYRPRRPWRSREGGRSWSPASAPRVCWGFSCSVSFSWPATPATTNRSIRFCIRRGAAPFRHGLGRDAPRHQ